MLLNKFFNFFQIGIWFLVIASSSIDSAAAQPASYKNTSAPIVVAFTRHTFRGTTKMIPPPALKVSNLKIQNNVLAYGMDATVSGLHIAEQYGKEAYNEGVRLALKTINSDSQLAGHWSEIRPDLATQRTFWTAVSLSQGLTSASGDKIPMLACPTKQGVAVDAISADSSLQMQCVSSKLDKKQHDLIKTQIASNYVQLANRLISLLGGKPNVTQANPYLSFSNIKQLSSLIEFSSDFNGSPLNRVLFHPSTKVLQSSREAVVTALNILGYSVLLNSAGLSAEISALAKINYVMSLKAGSQKIILTHDHKISALLQSLGLLSSGSNPNDLAIYPLETVIIALNARKVAIVRTRINVDKNGAMTGKFGFKSWVFWSGTRKEWNARVAALRARVNHDPHVNACLQKILPCNPVRLRLMVVS